MTDLATTIHNERTKLTATWLNGLAIAVAAIGGVAPLVSVLSDSAIWRSPLLACAIIVLVWSPRWAYI